VVENWPDDWAQPYKPELSSSFNEALSAIVALTEDDEQEPTLCIYSADGAPSVSGALSQQMCIERMR